MSNSYTILETLNKKQLLETDLKELIQLNDAAQKVFNNWFSLSKMNDVLETAWKRLSMWNYRHDNKIFIQGFDEIQQLFFNVTTARINRDEFKAALTGSCDSIEKAIQEIQAKIFEEEKKVEQLYNDFVQTTGEFKFIFENEQIKHLILCNLLKR